MPIAESEAMRHVRKIRERQADIKPHKKKKNRWDLMKEHVLIASLQQSVKLAILAVATVAIASRVHF